MCFTGKLEKIYSKKLTLQTSIFRRNNKNSKPKKKGGFQPKVPE